VFVTSEVSRKGSPTPEGRERKSRPGKAQEAAACGLLAGESAAHAAFAKRRLVRSVDGNAA